MKKILFALCCLALAGAAHAQYTLRLMTYNVRNANGLDGRCNYQRVANAITNAQPDVVAVQEVDSATSRSGGTYVLGELAERTQMRAYFAPAIAYDGGKYGIGLLARQEPLRVETVALPGREEARVMLVAEFDDFVYACAHLSLTEEDRLASVRLIEERARTCGKPFFLAGDMNDGPESAFLKAMKQTFDVLSNPKQATYPADRPKETIDYIFARKGSTDKMVPIAVRVRNGPVASDHRPVTVELRVAEKPERLFRTRPYLQNPLDGGVTVMWETTVPTYSWVEYGTDITRLKRARLLMDGQAVCNNTLHKIRIDSLQPGQTYFYRVCSQEILLYQAYEKVFGYTARSGFSRVTLPKPDADSFTAVVSNDLHQHGRTCEACASRFGRWTAILWCSTAIVWTTPRTVSRPPGSSVS